MASGFFDFHARVNQGRRGIPAASSSAISPSQPPAAMTVTELSNRISGVIRSGFAAAIWVRGEVSNYRGPHSSGHHYFSLKDANNMIGGVMFASDARSVRFNLTEGMEVLAQGTVTTFGAKSVYQLKVTQLLPVGQGALELAFRQLKDRLAKEGWFDAERKRPIPPFPGRIALVTSRGAAGLADMLKVLQAAPWVKLSLFHVPVQGAAAAPAIAAALAAINQHAASLGGVDVILLGRGGGSLEDLWAFNEEIVASAVASSEIPIVTGIGHQVDVSIADLVADYHAHTPTEAARIVTQHWRQAAQMVAGAAGRLSQRTGDLLRRATEQVLAVRRHETFRRPIDVIVRARQQRIDHTQQSLKLAMHDRLASARDRLNDLDRRLQLHRPVAQLAALRARLDRSAARLAERHPRHLVRRLDDRLRTNETRLRQTVVNAVVQQGSRLNAAESLLRKALVVAVARQSARLDAMTRQLDAVGPMQVLRRGYSITIRKRDRAIIKSASEIKTGDQMITRFADSEYEWTAGDGQMRLF